MKDQVFLNIYSFSNPALHTEWASLLGDKYCHSMPFSLKFVDDINDAHVIAWDGVITPKGHHYMDKVVEKLKSGALLLLMGEARTLFKDSPIVELLNLDQIRYVELTGWSLLPEDMIQTLKSCHQKTTHV